MSGRGYPVCARCGARLYQGEHHRPRWVAIYKPMQSFPPPPDFDFESELVREEINGCIIHKDGFDPVYMPSIKKT